tara:strand:+ start:260 stop:523 length:264 start_codon:yes stop_codon:yes gene_type:complete
MAWELLPIEIGSKKLDGNVNIGEGIIDIEIPYFKSFKHTDVVKIDKKSYTITGATNVGDRDEYIHIEINTENNNGHKQDKKGNDSTV